MLRAAVCRAARYHCSSTAASSTCRTTSGSLRLFSSINYDTNETDLDALFNETLVKRHVKDVSPGRLLTTQREAISLYRLIFRYSRLFIWSNDAGIPWRDVIRDSARKEYEAARFETDPSIINRMLVVGRDAVDEAKTKFMAKRDMIIADEQARLRAGLPPRNSPPM